MRVPPQVSDRIKEAPAQALRGVFAGIGQVLLITDKLRNKTPADQQTSPARAPEPSKARAEPVATVRQAPPAPPASPTPAAAADTAAEKVPAASITGTEPGAPLPNYDELSIASLRARLRNLDVVQVRELAEYEKAHAARADVVTMFERRIAKLEAEMNTEAHERGEAKAEAEIEGREAEEAEVQEEAEAEAEGET
jgi:hypothetical protein